MAMSESPPASALPVLERSSPEPKRCPTSTCVVATRHVHTAASSETPGWRSRRWSERYWPRSRPAPASASQSSASLLPGETPAASAPAVQYHPCALSSAAAHDLSRWEHQTLTSRLLLIGEEQAEQSLRDLRN